MNFGKDIRIYEDMLKAVEGGAAIAWQLLATLEGGSLLLATSALLAYTVRNKILRTNRAYRNIQRVLVTNSTNLLGRELKKRLEARGCVVEDLEVNSNGTNAAGSEVRSDARNAVRPEEKVDALLVIGAEPKADVDGLDGMTRLVTEDVYNNLKLLECLSSRVRRGGCIVWVCAGDGAPGPFSDAGAAFDTVLRASLQHVAKVSHCEPIWVGRCEGAEQAAERVVSALLTDDVTSHYYRFSIRNAAHRVGERLYRWLKIVT